MTISVYDFARIFEGYVIALDGDTPSEDQWGALREQFERIDEFQELTDADRVTLAEGGREILFQPGEALRQHLAKRDED